MPGRRGTRYDSIQAELVGKHVAEWATQFADLPVFGDGFLSPWEILSERSGLDYTYIYKLAKGMHRSGVRFDAADRLFCAMGDPLRYWLGDPELAEIYEDKCRHADRIELGRTEMSEYQREKERKRSREYKARKKAERLAA